MPAAAVPPRGRRRRRPARRDLGGAKASGGPAARPRPAGPAWRDASFWVRAGLALTACCGVVAHIAGVVTRGLAVHRVPWGDMYEFVIALTCVAVLFFLGLMIRYRAYYLGLFVMAPVVIVLGLAQTSSTPRPARWCPR